MNRTHLAAAAAVLAVAAGTLTIVTSTSTSSAETPAERCERETNDYNRNWENIWRTTHPGDPGPPPPPPVPYQCHDPGPDPTPPSTTTTPGPSSPTTTAPTTTTTAPPTSDTPTVDPSGTAPTVAPGPFTLPGQPGPRPGPDAPAVENPDEIAGSACAAARDRIGGQFAAQLGSAKGLFSCNGTQLDFWWNAGPGLERRVLTNTSTGATQEVTGLPDQARETVAEQLGLRQASSDGDGCRPGTTPGPKKFVDSPYRAHAQFSWCYGEFHGVNGPPAWSHRIDYIWRHNLTNRFNHTMQIENVTPTRREVAVTLGWRLRKDISFWPDEELASDAFHEKPWTSGDSDSVDYRLNDNWGTYFIEHTTIELDDYPTAEHFSQVIDVKLPRFSCPNDGGETLCTFKTPMDDH